MNAPTVSVIIPTYNYGRFIRKAIDCALHQEENTVEVIVVDDGSTDETSAVLESYGSRVRKYRLPHKGAPIARNYGLSMANGEFIVFLDADDWMLPDALHTRVDFLKRNPSYEWVYGPWFVYNENDNDITNEFMDLPLAFKKPQQGRILDFLLLGGLMVTCAVMLRASLVRRVGGFSEDLPIYQDYDLWLRIAGTAPVGYIKHRNVAVLRHRQSLSHTTNDGYETLTKILLNAEKQLPDITKNLGFKWKRRLSHVLAERGRHLSSTGTGKIKEGRNYLIKAIQQNPLNFHHYVGYLKTFLNN